MLFESFEEFGKNMVTEKVLSDYAKDTDELQLEYPDAKVIDINSSKVKYDKRNKRFEIKEKDFKDFDKFEKIILNNSKTSKGVMAKKGGKIKGSKVSFRGRSESDGTYVGEFFWAGPGESGIPYNLRHELWVYYNKPQEMTHAEKMGSGFYGPLD